MGISLIGSRPLSKKLQNLRGKHVKRFKSTAGSIYKFKLHTNKCCQCNFLRNRLVHFLKRQFFTHIPFILEYPPNHQPGSITKFCHHHPTHLVPSGSDTSFCALMPGYRPANPSMLNGSRVAERSPPASIASSASSGANCDKMKSVRSATVG